MTRTDVVASSRPQTAAAARLASRPGRALRRRLVLPVVLLIGAAALVVPTAALAAEEGLSTYNETKTTTSAAAPAPAKETAPVTAEQPKAATLPFTGLDLGNVVIVGLLLMGAGFSIVVVQRRQQRRADR